MTSQKNSDVELVWEAPADPRAVSGLYGSVLSELKEHIGEWGRVRVMRQGSAHGAAGNLRARLKDNPRWEVRSAPILVNNMKTGNYGIYVRYRTDEQMGEARASGAAES